MIEMAVPTPTRAFTPGKTSPARLHVGGTVRRPAELDGDALERAGAVELSDFVVICTFDGSHGRARRMRGLPLRTLITRSEPDFAQRTDFKRTVILACAEDGYRALFSWCEVFHTDVGEGIYVAFDSPLAPLDDKTGPFALVSLRDTFTGPRFVRRLASVELHRLW